MNKVINYFKNVYKELVEKTSWPTWNDLFNSARVVMIASIIIAIIVLAMDWTFMNVLKVIYNAL